METTLALIKPDAVRAGNVGSIINEIEREFFIGDMIFDQWNEYTARSFYTDLREREFFEDLLSFMTSGPMVMMTLVGANAVDKWRHMIGPTDPKTAPPDTIRGMFGSKTMPIMYNAVHGSDSVVSAYREISLLKGVGFLHGSVSYNFGGRAEVLRRSNIAL